MHSFANVVKDSVNVLRPTTKGFVNRTEKINVRNGCKELGIFKELHIPEQEKEGEPDEVQSARWTYTSDQIESIHEKMKSLPTGLRKPFRDWWRRVFP